MTALLPASSEYLAFLADLKERVRAAQLRAALSVNRELVLLYWSIGRDILDRQRQAGWGSKVIDQLAHDLLREFPEMKGFSPRNLKYMRAFAEAWPEESIVQAALAQLTWYHQIALMEKLKSPEERLAYARAAFEHGWSRPVLVMQIESGFLKRKGIAVTNFARTLPPPHSDLAQQTLKDPYVFDFLERSGNVHERQLERSLVEHIRSFLLELGVGFAFVGQQVHLRVGGEDFYLDMLFYHLRLRCYIVVELKTRAFKPEYAGKMNFYLAAADDLIRDPEKDGPTLGLLLCKTKNRVVVEYALHHSHRPIGVAEYQFTRALPENLLPSLPTVAAIEAELQQNSMDEIEEEQQPATTT